jgi:hypothetical protein
MDEERVSQLNMNEIGAVEFEAQRLGFGGPMRFATPEIKKRSIKWKCIASPRN